MGREGPAHLDASVVQAEAAGRGGALKRGTLIILLSAAALIAAGGIARWSSAPTPRSLPATPTAPRASMRDVVGQLTSPAFGGRALGSAGEARTAAYIAAQFDALGLPPLPGEVRTQPFTATLDGGSVNSAGNVVAWLDAGAADTIILGAHYDHLGEGGLLSRDFFERGLHPGADDNASGVAALLALAEPYATGARRAPANLVFVAFSGEEEGLLGATAFLAQHPALLGHVRAYVNFEMVGRLDREHPSVGLEGVQETPAWHAVLAKVPPQGYTLTTDSPITPGGSDHAVFAARGLPVLSLTTGATSDYHRRSDTADKLNLEGLQALVAWTGDLLDALGPALGSLAPPSPG